MKHYTSVIFSKTSMTLHADSTNLWLSRGKGYQETSPTASDPGRAWRESSMRIAAIASRGEVQAPAVDTLRPLMVRIAARHEDALAALYRITVSRLKDISWAVLKSRDDAEEIVADVFLYVWLNVHRYNEARGSVMAWLAVITRNRSIDRIRRHRVIVKTNDKHIAGWLSSSVDAPDWQFGRQQQLVHLADILAHLSPLHRELVSLAFLQGLRHEDIAGVVGLPLGTVKSHIRRTLLTIRVQLQSTHRSRCHSVWSHSNR
jgi:RNA polymerase sigma-70 factor (ECF subfamily)